MTPTRDQTRTELRLAEVDALAQSLDQLAQELAAYKEALLAQLEVLRQQTNHRSPPAQETPAKEPWQRTRATFQGGDPLPLPEPTPTAAPNRQDSGLRRGLAAAAADIELPPEIPARPAGGSGVPARPAGGSGVPARPAGGSGVPARPAGGSGVPTRPAGGSGYREPVAEPPPESPPALRRSDSGFRKTAAPLADPKPTKKTDSGTRRGGKPISILIADLGDDAEPIPGWVVERTANSLRLLVDEELSVGCVYSIRPAKDHPNAQWVQISIKSCVQERSSFAVLAQFLERPPWTALALF